ncbi:MAG: TRASH domain-containing protein [Thermodesulfobacteriota bacterium]
MIIISKRLAATLAFMIFTAFSFAGVSYAKELSPEKVEAVKVCMINNRVMAEPQIPVEIGNKTYYGCCAGCANKLKNEEGARFSKDPLTGSKVDKATAYIISGLGGEALYFESEKNAQNYVMTNKGKIEDK